MKQDVLFMGKELHVEGDNLSDILHYAFPQMVEAAIAVYNDLSFANNASKETTKVVDDIDAMDMNNKDIMGDVYEYLLGKIAGHGLDKEIICQKCANTASTLTNAMVDVEKLPMYSLATVQHQTPF